MATCHATLLSQFMVRGRLKWDREVFELKERASTVPSSEMINNWLAAGSFHSEEVLIPAVFHIRKE